MKAFPRAAGGDKLIVFQDLNLVIEPGKTLAIVGPSGCGKTTLLNMIGLLEQHDAGMMLFDGRPKTVQNAGTLSMGYLFQRDALLPWRTALGNALLGLTCRGKISEDAKKLVASYFGRFGLRGFENAWPQTLSGGQRQRVALIQNLLLNPDVLLLDEPFGSLDYQTKLILEEELLSVTRSENGNGRRKTVVLVTHDIEQAIVMADRVIVLGLPPLGIIFDEQVCYAEKVRNPVTARQSDVMRRLFGKIWSKLQPEADRDSEAGDANQQQRIKSSEQAVNLSDFAQR